MYNALSIKASEFEEDPIVLTLPVLLKSALAQRPRFKKYGVILLEKYNLSINKPALSIMKKNDDKKIMQFLRRNKETSMETRQIRESS